MARWCGIFSIWFDSYWSGLVRPSVQVRPVRPVPHWNDWSGQMVRSDQICPTPVRVPGQNRQVRSGRSGLPQTGPNWSAGQVRSGRSGPVRSGQVQSGLVSKIAHTFPTFPLWTKLAFQYTSTREEKSIAEQKLIEKSIKISVDSAEGT
jgi:hypothetical protein